MAQRERQQQGWQANRNGTFLKQELVDRLIRQGYHQWKAPPTLMQEAFFVYRGDGLFQSLYGTPITFDVYLYHPWKHPEGLIITSKYQEVSGSVDEKLPYLVGSLKATGTRAYLLLIGSGARKEAIQWCQAQQDEALTVLTTWHEWIWLFSHAIL
jgi:hypothetical protein